MQVTAAEERQNWWTSAHWSDPNVVISDMPSDLHMLNRCMNIYTGLSLTDEAVIFQENTATGSAVIYGGEKHCLFLTRFPQAVLDI